MENNICTECCWRPIFNRKKLLCKACLNRPYRYKHDSTNAAKELARENKEARQEDDQEQVSLFLCIRYLS